MNTLISRLPRRVRVSMQAAIEEAEAVAHARLEPTAERRQHGSIIEVETIQAGVRVRCVQSPIDRYEARGSLNQRQAEAARDLRQDWEFGIAGSKNSDLRGIGGGMVGYTDAQLHAAMLYQQAVQAIGPRICIVVLPIVIGYADGGEITVDMLARQQAANAKAVMGILKVGLDILGDHYARCFDKRRSAKYA